MKKMEIQKGRHYSMRGQLSLLLGAIIVADLVIIGLVTWFCLGPFYKKDKIRKMRDAYVKVVQMTENTENLADEIMELSVQDNIMILIANSDLSDSQSTKHDSNRNLTRLFGYISGFYEDKITILERTEEYTLQETSDSRISTSYLEMWGQTESGSWFLLQTPLESMTSAVKLTMMFYVMLGCLVILLSLMIVFFAMRRYTRPISRLTELSKQMANLDFEAKYTGHEKNEIGELGKSFNKMSSELEQTISELKSANIELQKDNEQKTQIDEMRKEFLANVSHELKTPLALIQGYAEGLRDGIAEDPDSRDFYLDVIMDEASKMNTMVRKLLTLNQIEFGNDPVNLECFDLTQLISGVLQGMQLMIGEAEAEVEFAPSGSVMVWADEFKIEEVMTNYLSNAVHHISGSRRIRISVEKTDTNTIKTTVFNTGNPIPEADLGHIFEKFYKVDKARTREYGGSGIGLSIVKAIMEGHHQQCGVKNEKDGVAFWFTLEGK